MSSKDDSERWGGGVVRIGFSSMSLLLRVQLPICGYTSDGDEDMEGNNSSVLE